MNKHIKLNILLIVVTLWCISNLGAYSQILSSNSRYLQTQYFENPGYTGTSNKLAVNVVARKQWLGLDGAPTCYHLSAQSPINNTMMSLGGGIHYEQFGINKFYSASASYAYLLKISPSLFLSLGVNANFSNYQVGFNQLNLIHNNDPYFTAQNETGSDFNMGTGAFLYGRRFYFGVSSSRILNISNTNDSQDQFPSDRNYYAATGYLLKIDNKYSVKPSLMYRCCINTDNELSTGFQFMYKDIFWYGAVYNQGGWLANVLNIRINKDLEVAYAFENAVGEHSVKRNNHEISVLFSINTFIKENLKREFGEPKGRRTKEGIKSMRYF